MSAHIPHFRYRNEWSRLPDTEVERLQKTLLNHLRQMNILMTKSARTEHVTTLLEKQNQTCAFGKNVGGIYCWNEPKENFIDGVYTEKTYLKLQWGHIKPRSRKEEQTIDNLCLLCARCNNQIQTSRHLSQLKAELLSKIEHIDSMISSTTSSEVPV
jgi:5-methylcytosine-specific restriction endonuclease McrA